MNGFAVVCALAVLASSAAADVRQFLVVGGQDFGKAEFERLYLRDNPGETVEMIDAVVDDSAVVRWLPDGDCFKAAMAKARAASARGQVVGVLWHQGEADAGRQEDVLEYSNRLARVVSAFRQAFDAPLPFIASGCGDFVGCHLDGDGRQDRPFASRISDITQETMDRLPRCRYATSFNARGNCRDDIHFSPSSLLEMGARVYRQWTLLDNRRIGKFPSRDYEVRVGGRRVDVIATPRSEHWRSPGAGYERSERGNYSYAPFVLAQEAEIEVRSAEFDLSRAEILPTSKGVNAACAERGRLVFRMKPGQTLVVEPNGREQALVLAANPLDPTAPRSGSGRLRYYGPGYHRAGFIELKDGESVYLADGAWVEGLIYGRGKDIGVFGPGVISGAPYDWRCGPSKFRAEPGVTRTGAVITLCGENVFVRDVTVYSGWVYNLAFNQVTNAVVDNVKVIGGRCLNDDGIDPCRAKDVVIRNSFVHTRDDCIAPKFWIENLTVSNCTLWTDNANAVRVGFECDPPETKTMFRNISFKDIDILHLSDMRRRFCDFWAFAALTVEAANDQPFTDILFDGVRVHDCRPGELLIDVRTKDISEGGLPACHCDTAGIIRGLVFRNIRSAPDMCVGLQAHDDAHPIEGVVFENVDGLNRPFVKGKVEWTTRPPAARDLSPFE